ncbi:hypothetical protein B723_26795 [Pseudomonas fluorescens NCIMB 11764]|uniref:Uncharacterized protein n=2 Tax=Pseudomonas TaxID=286 RepID=A0A0K1QZ31_PSEFL|nr:hypothetical protein B723_26795 [Pseudomonas fluorescens NCIMB 11764]
MCWTSPMRCAMANPMDHDAPPGMDPARDPAAAEPDRPEDWMDPAAEEDVPPPDEPTPLSDDRR